MIVFIFGRVPRCARVGLFRTALTLGAALRFALPNGMLHSPHAATRVAGLLHAAQP
ncbi:MAG: hypothetical protein RML94_04535 [Bacteroidia bacterium]|nr:hypothetical protein [Bacteroidia bacterium]